MENRKGSGIFLGVIGVATLVVAIIGATFAYFSASAGSDGATITAGSGTIDLGFQDLTQDGELKTALIPVYDNLAKYAEESENTAANGRCIDDNGNDVCSVYTFMIGNPSATTTQDVFGSITITTNTFNNLYFRMYDITDGEEQVVGPTNLDHDAPTKIGENDIAVTYDTTNMAWVIPAGADATDGKSIELKIGLTGVTGEPVRLAPSKTAISADNVDNLDSYVAAANTDTNGNTNYKKYKVVLWVREVGQNQTTVDSAQTFAASINFTTGTGTGVTGVLASAGVAGKNETGA